MAYPSYTKSIIKKGVVSRCRSIIAVKQLFINLVDKWNRLWLILVSLKTKSHRVRWIIKLNPLIVMSCCYMLYVSVFCLAVFVNSHKISKAEGANECITSQFFFIHFVCGLDYFVLCSLSSPYLIVEVPPCDGPCD